MFILSTPLFLALPVEFVLVLAALGDLQRQGLRRRHPVRVVVADDKLVRISFLARHGNVPLRYPGVALGLDKRLTLGICRGRASTRSEEKTERSNHHDAYHPRRAVSHGTPPTF